MRRGEDGNSHCFFPISFTILKTSLFISLVPFRKHLLRANCGPSSAQESVGAYEEKQEVAGIISTSGALHLKGKHFHAQARGLQGLDIHSVSSNNLGCHKGISGKWTLEAKSERLGLV